MITFQRYKVLVRDQNERVTEHDVVINHQDTLRAELELSRAGLDMRKAVMHLTTAWAWAALTRAGVYSGPFSRFADMDCVALEDDGEEEVTPTPPAPEEELSGVGSTSSSV